LEAVIILLVLVFDPFRPFDLSGWYLIALFTEAVRDDHQSVRPKKTRHSDLETLELKEIGALDLLEFLLVADLPVVAQMLEQLIEFRLVVIAKPIIEFFAWALLVQANRISYRESLALIGDGSPHPDMPSC
jgi:hypothetical protein